MPLSKEHSKARDFIASFLKDNPNATAAQVVSAARKANKAGDLLASVLKVIEVLAPVIIAILKALG